MSGDREFDVVTGAFGYTGKYISRQLLNAGRRVRTITGHANRANGLSHQVEIAPMNFGDFPGLIQSLRGAATLYNTYWVRFSHGKTTFDNAVANSRLLIEAAREAGVRKVVHLSIANPSLDLRLPYYAGKARVEQAIVDSGLSYSILRPTVIFGPEDILINNIAWFTRRFPVFAIPGDGRYGIQPIFVEDIANLAVAEGRNAANRVLDAVGPETFPFEELVRRIADAVGSKTHIFHLGPRVTAQALRVVGSFIGDIVLTQEEIDALEANLLVSHSAPTGRTRFTGWLEANAETLGRAYSSELQRHYQ
jgi:uncharacterized protein YbjT (DUF2867 family)